jgi:septal ring factor EnvC (AmiA/AmiB activator)
MAEARARRKAEQAAARALAAKESSVLELLEQGQRARAAADQELAKAEAARGGAEAVVARAREDEAGAQAKLDAALARLRPRLAARARMGRLGGLRLLLASGSLSELAQRRYYLDRILARDAQLLQEARAGRDAREEARRAKEEHAARLAGLAEAAAARRAEASERAAEQRALLEAIRGEKALHERAAAEAAAQERGLAGLVASLAPSPPAIRAAEGFGALRGQLPRPADGPVVAGFGQVVDARSNTVTNHPGVDIRAPRGAPVRAVAPGRVVHAGWFRGYGNLVIVDHGDGFHTLVAHLASLSAAVGEDVGAGSLLGTVGDTGSLRGDLVYFEVRERQRPVDPSLWLAPALGDIVAR